MKIDINYSMTKPVTFFFCYSIPLFVHFSHFHSFFTTLGHFLKLFDHFLANFLPSFWMNLNSTILTIKHTKKNPKGLLIQNFLLEFFLRSKAKKCILLSHKRLLFSTVNMLYIS